MARKASGNLLARRRHEYYSFSLPCSRSFLSVFPSGFLREKPPSLAFPGTLFKKQKEREWRRWVWRERCTKKRMETRRRTVTSRARGEGGRGRARHGWASLRRALPWLPRSRTSGTRRRGGHAGAGWSLVLTAGQTHAAGTLVPEGGGWRLCGRSAVASAPLSPPPTCEVAAVPGGLC